MYPANTIFMYQCMMNSQKRGSFCFTEYNLLDMARHFWYRGDEKFYFEP